MATKHIFILATRRTAELKPFAQALEADDQVTLIQVAGGQETLDTAVRVVPGLVIVDQELDENGGQTLARQLLQVNAFIQTVILSDMDEEAFHEATEGLGVLMRLPLTPDGGDADRLLSLYRKVMP